jgi:hypothetical protein
MSNALLYRYYAADCLFAAESCDKDYRGLLFSIATAWRGLAQQDDAVAKLLAGWEAEANAGTHPNKSTISLVA